MRWGVRRMKIKYITEDDLNSIKTNLPNILKRVVCGRECTISELFSNSSFIKSTSLEIENFTLDDSQIDGQESLTDVENVQRVYSHMRFLTDSQASDERIWAAYTFSENLDYMRYRWPANRIEDLNNRYLFGYSIQRSLFRNGISRLWWIGRFTYDVSRDDPFELTKFLCRDQDFIESICGRNIFNNPMVGNAVISALYDAEKAGMDIDRETVRGISKYVNLLSGTYMLETLDKNEIYKKVTKKLEMR